MNERIKKLKRQAINYVDSIDVGFGIERYRELVDQKFAEYIVRECAIIAFEEWRHNGTSGEAAIMEHFGVG